jgi:hypothetical protein
MELSSFSENIVTVPFERNGEVVMLQINIDAITPHYYEHLEQRLLPVNERLEALRAQYDAMVDAAEKAKKRKKGSKQSGDVAKQPSLLSLEKELAEIQREVFAERLTCPVALPDGSSTSLLKGWDITESGMAITPSKENLMRLPPKLVEGIWERVIARASTVKKTADEGTTQNQMTSETTGTGSQEFTIPFNAPVM